MKKFTRFVALALCSMLLGSVFVACAMTKYKVTIGAVDAEQGTVVVKIGDNAVTSGSSYKKDSNLEITMTPAVGYEFESLLINNDAKTVTGTGDVKTFTHKLSSAATIKVTFSMILTKVSSVSVVDGADGYTPVTAPLVGQVLRANVILANGQVVGTYPATTGVTYKWYYVENDQVIGTQSSYTVTSDNLGKKLAVKATFTDVVGVENGSATWTAGQEVDILSISEVLVIDGSDGFTPVTNPRIGQVLAANVKLSNGAVIGTYPETTGVAYEWYYDENGQVVGTESRFTVTTDNVGKTIAVKVTFADVNGVEDGFATWTAEQAVTDNNTALVTGFTVHTWTTGNPDVGVETENWENVDGTIVVTVAEGTKFIQLDIKDFLAENEIATITRGGNEAAIYELVAANGYNGNETWRKAGTDEEAKTLAEMQADETYVPGSIFVYPGQATWIYFGINHNGADFISLEGGEIFNAVFTAPNGDTYTLNIVVEIA